VTQQELAKLVGRARDVLTGKSRSYVDDAIAFAPIVVDYDLTVRNLTSVQLRCTQLIEENRRLRGEPPESKPSVDVR
jgi:hypothetical protein